MGSTAGARLDRGARSPRLKKASERYSVRVPRLRAITPVLVTDGSVEEEVLER